LHGNLLLALNRADSIQRSVLVTVWKGVGNWQKYPCRGV
jgi:hypothetical protein